MEHKETGKRSLETVGSIALLVLASWGTPMIATAQQGNVSQSGTVTEKGWTGAFGQKSESSFGMTFADNVVLNASAISRPVVGREKVQATMSAASKIYEKLEFTDQVSNGRRTWLEWQAVALGGREFGGVTILTRNEDGKIANISIHHRPLWAAAMFGKELHRRLPEVITVDHIETEFRN